MGIAILMNIIGNCSDAHQDYNYSRQGAKTQRSIGRVGIAMLINTTGNCYNAHRHYSYSRQDVYPASCSGQRHKAHLHHSYQKAIALKI